MVADREGPDSLAMIVAAHEATAGRLTASIEHLVPASWELRAEPTVTGAFVVAGASAARAGHWLVAGRPSEHPWGIPGRSLPCEDAAVRFERYGPAAVQITAGAFIALNVATGEAVRAMNGIMPLHASTRGRWVASTSAEVVSALAQGQPDRLAPGTSALPDGSSTDWAAAVSPGSAPVPWAWADAAARAELGVGPMTPMWDRDRDDRWAGQVFTAADGYAVFLPKLCELARDGDSLGAYARLHDEVLPRLWWRARLAGRWLCAPTFERPVLDTILMLRQASRFRRRLPS